MMTLIIKTIKNRILLVFHIVEMTQTKQTTETFNVILQREWFRKHKTHKKKAGHQLVKQTTAKQMTIQAQKATHHQKSKDKNKFI